MTTWIDWQTCPANLTAGRRIFIPGSSGEPTDFLAALATRPEMLAGSEVVTSFLPGINVFDFAAVQPNTHVTSFFPLPSAVASGPSRTRQIPISYFEITDFLRHYALDVSVLQVSPPDENGYCSLGPCIEFSLAAAAASKCRIGVVNDNIVRTPGEPALYFPSIDFAVRTTRPLHELSPPQSDDVTTRIAAHVAGLIDDGATIQTGIGKIPGQILAALTSRRRLRIHSGVVLPGVRDLVEAGAIVGRGSVLAASGAGDADFYRWLGRASAVRLTAVAETHRLERLMAIRNFAAINSAIEVDLGGQCNAEMIGGRLVSGAGGLPEFTTGAHRAPGGRSIIALPSTDAKGRVSRIVAQFAPGTPVAVPRQSVDFVVTEHGVADLRHKSVSARTDALIAIASPEFQSMLEAGRTA